MSSTGRLLIIVTLLSAAIAPATYAQTTARTAPTPARVRYNGKIVFSSDRHNKALSIWSINPDGSSPTRLTDDKDRTAKLPNFVSVYDSSPVWSPDGTEIAFISNRNYLFGLYVMNADGSNARLLTELPEPAQPAWSPDGSKIVFSAGIRITLEPHKPHTDIYVINVDGSGLTQLTRDSGLNGSPSWSPDGKQIAFVSNRDLDGKEKIWIMNADGTNQRIISTGVYGGLPAWSPDGNKILFTSSRTCPADIGIGIYVMNADGSDSRLLTNDPNSCGVYSWPRWSPDGTKIVTSFQPRGRGDITPARQILVMDADGSNPINISNRGQYYFNTGLSMFTDVEPHWQPLLTRPQVAASIIGFSAPSYTVNEKAGRVAITVTRTGNLNDVASCFYVTLSNTMPMLQHSDPAATGTLRFAPGESSKTISFTVGRHNADSYKLILSDNEGNATFLGGIKEATLTILR